MKARKKSFLTMSDICSLVRICNVGRFTTHSAGWLSGTFINTKISPILKKKKEKRPGFYIAYCLKF